METQTLMADRRTAMGRHVRRLRREGKLPAVVYGPGVDAAPIQLDLREASRILRRVHGAQLLDLSVEGEMRKVLLQDVQRDSIKGHFTHIDFYAVDMSRPIRVRLPVKLVGSSPAVTSLSGVLVHGLTELEIECLPADLPPTVEADLGAVKEIGQAIYVRDLYLPKTVKILTDADDLIARVTFQAKEEDLSAPAALVSSEVEVIEKGKLEEEGEEEGE